MNNKKAFTLLELLIVIIILGVLASFITSNFFTSLKKSRDSRRKTDLEQIQRALELYYEDKRVYPITISFGQSLTDTETGKIYMNKIPNDPYGNSYYYESNGNYYKLYACLENNQEILPYVIINLINRGFDCNNICKDIKGNKVSCIWEVSSSNTSP